MSLNKEQCLYWRDMIEDNIKFIQSQIDFQNSPEYDAWNKSVNYTPRYYNEVDIELEKIKLNNLNKYIKENNYDVI
jgi:hypothetical protein